MSKHNYTNYSKKNRNSDEAVVPMSMRASMPEPEKTPDVNDTTDSGSIYGVVDNCRRLNVREKPSVEAEILTALKAGSEVRLLKDEMENGFYKICTASGLEGYCMCEYIVLK